MCKRGARGKRYGYRVHMELKGVNAMRGSDAMQESLFMMAKLEDFVPADHPLRPIRLLVNRALARLHGLFHAIYADSERESIAPEKLLRALLLQVFYSVRSERMLMEQMRYNLLFRWFVGLAIEDTVWDHSVFSKNRDRLLENEVIESFFTEVMTLADKAGLLSKEHFTVDGTLIEAWAGQKSFRPKDEPPDSGPGGSNPTVNFRGERRTNVTHASRTDPDARMVRKARGQASHLGYHGHVLMENRNGLVAQATLTIASGFAEREAAIQMVDRISSRGRITLGADKGYDVADFIAACRDRDSTPHLACTSDARRRSAIDGRKTRHSGYTVSQR